MGKLMTEVLGIAAVALSGPTATVPWARGNGNDGSGAPSAATSGMTYHSEPVSSAWYCPPRPMAQDEKNANTDGRMASIQKRPDAAQASR